MDELEAVNRMLEMVGEQPVSSLEGIGVQEAAMALRALRDASGEVQGQGWHFNTDAGLVLTPDAEERIPLPANCLRVDTVGASRCHDVVPRGGFLYDRRRHTHAFPGAVTVDMVVELPFGALPAAAKRYVAIKAARRFANGLTGSTALYQLSEREELEAKVELMHEEADQGDFNMLTGSNPSRRATIRDGWL